MGVGDSLLLVDVEVIVIHLSEKAAEADETKFCSDFEDLSIIPAAHPPICGA